MNCPLCKGEASFYTLIKNRTFFKCLCCCSVFVDYNDLPSFENEKARYLLHQNDMNNEGYRSFVSPIVEAVKRKFNTTSSGLDFGSGTNSAAAEILREKGMNISLYDPFFHPNNELLTKKYNYIICCEVVEHFHDPYNEFRLLRSLLKPKGELICMTDLYNVKIDFENWYYKNDFTHVFFYHPKAFNYIAQEFGFSSVKISGRLISLSV